MSTGSDVTELQDIDVHEVSLVDAPAIRRKFLIIKREDQMDDTLNAIPAEAEVDEASTAEADVINEADVTKEEAAADSVEATPEDDTADADEVQKDETQEAAAETSEEAPVEDAEDTDIEKAKRMTAGRMARLDQMYKELGDLLKDLQPPQAGDATIQGQPNDGAVPNVPAVGQYSASVAKSDIEAVVTAAIEKAIQPILDALTIQKSDDQPVKAGVEGDDAKEVVEESTEEVVKASEEDPEKADLRKRLSTLEGTSNAGTADSTDTISKNNNKTMWAGIV